MSTSFLKMLGLSWTEFSDKTLKFRLSNGQLLRIKIVRLETAFAHINLRVKAA